jgi:hypothetical protein
MSQYSSEACGNTRIVRGPRNEYVGSIPNGFTADTIVRHLNVKDRRPYTIVDQTKVAEIRSPDNDIVLSTRTPSLNPRLKALTRSELEVFLTHLNRPLK